MSYPQEFINELSEDEDQLRKQLRQLQRALWLARARTAYTEYRLFVIDSVDNIDGIEADKYERMAEKWQKVECKCRAKAEEYK